LKTVAQYVQAKAEFLSHSRKMALKYRVKSANKVLNHIYPLGLFKRESGLHNTALCLLHYVFSRGKFCRGPLQPTVGDPALVGGLD